MEGQCRQKLTGGVKSLFKGNKIELSQVKYSSLQRRGSCSEWS